MTALGRSLLHDLSHEPRRVLERHGADIPELAAMSGCEQPSNHHAEGDVWAHTQLALEVHADVGAAVHQYAGEALAAAGLEELALPPRSLTQALAVLLHDVGKPPTARRDAEGRWTYYGHDRVGATMARELCERLKLETAADELDLPLDVEGLAWLITEHLFWLNTDVEKVTDRAVLRRFDESQARGDDLRVLAWCDTLGSRGPQGVPSAGFLITAELRIACARARAATSRRRTAAVLDGHEVMRALGLSPGPEVGAVLARIRSRTDDETEARRLLRELASAAAE
ncbi:MAG: HD domain-containing protein [Egibacteraceae bacterium]